MHPCKTKPKTLHRQGVVQKKEEDTMILSDGAIKKALKNGEIEITDYEDKQLQPASYDLRVGKQGVTIQEKKIEDISETSSFTVGPGDAAIIITHEIIGLDNSHAARFDLTSSHARKGIFATTGAQIDPGFRGRLFVGIANLTPDDYTFTFKEDFLTLEVHKLSEPSTKSYSGHNQNKTELTEKDVENLLSSEGLAISGIMKSIQSLKTEMQDLKNRVKNLLISRGILALWRTFLSLF